MTGIKIILFGIVLILASLFCLGFVIMNGTLGGLALTLFIAGLIVCAVGFIWDIKM